MSFHPPNIDPFQSGLQQLNNGFQDLSMTDQSHVSTTPKKNRRPARAFHSNEQWRSQPSTPNLSHFPSTPHMTSFGSQANTPTLNRQTSLQSFAPVPTPTLNRQASFHTPQTQFAGQSSTFSPFNTPQMADPTVSQFGSPQFNSPEQEPQSHHQGVKAEIPQPGRQFIPDGTLSVPGKRYESSKEFLDSTFMTFQNACPPLATTQYSVQDQGTASPKFMRSSMYQIPVSEQLRSVTKLPVGLTMRPFAPTEGDETVPQVDLRTIGGPPRCRRCRTYMNPAMQHTRDYRFICNMCEFPNPCPSEYTSPIAPNGQRVDFYQRPELHKGVVDYVVPEEYFLNEVQPKALHHIFLIDVSEDSVKKHLPELAADAIRSTLYSNTSEDTESKFPENGRIAIITFDRTIHFYNLSPELEQPQLSVVSDVGEPFVPFSEGLFVDPSESRMIIEDVLNRIGAASGFITPEIAFGGALNACRAALETVGGGKITAILSSFPSWGAGTVKLRQSKIDPSVTEKEKEYLIADNEFYKKLTTDLATANVGVDLFAVSHTPIELQNIGHLVSKTGGQVKLYQNFNVDRDQRNFISDFKASILNSAGYQGQLKVRCSNGLQVLKYYGGYTPSEMGDANIPVLSSDQTFSVLFSYDGKLNTKLDAHFQAALLYTSKEGLRKVRVINLVLAVSERANDIFSFADLDTVTSIIARDTTSFVGAQTLTELRNSTNTKLVEVCTNYRALTTISASSLQLVFPESLTCLPMFILALQKSRILKGAKVNYDAKIASSMNITSLPLERLSYYLYPAFIELHSMNDDEALFREDGKFITPEAKPASTSILQFGCYFVFNGEKLYLWVHPQANPLLLRDLFGVDSINDIDPLLDELPTLETSISFQARNIVKYYASVIGKDFLGVQMARVGLDVAEHEVLELCVEDRGLDKTESYADYLQHIHKSIKSKLENEKPIKANLEHDNSTLAQRMIHF